MVVALAVVVGLLLLAFLVQGLILQLVWALLGGLVVGALGRLVVPGRQRIGLLVTALIGIAGGFLGGLLASALARGSLVSFLLSLGCAAVLVAIADARAVRGDVPGGRSPARR